MSLRVSLLDDDGDLKAPVGTKPWAKAITVKLRNKLKDWSSDAKSAGVLARTVKKGRAWESLGYASFGIYCCKELRIDEEIAEKLAEAKPGETIGTVLGQHGGDRKSEGRDQGDNVTLISRGNAESYTLARLRRDRPELAEAVERKELSANAAAIKAGFRHPMISVRRDDAPSAVRTLLKHYNRSELIDAIKGVEA